MLLEVDKEQLGVLKRALEARMRDMQLRLGSEPGDEGFRREATPQKIGASADSASTIGTSFVAAKLDFRNSAAAFTSGSIARVIWSGSL